MAELTQPYMRTPRPLLNGRLAQAALDGLLVDAREQVRRWQARERELIARGAREAVAEASNRGED